MPQQESYTQSLLYRPMKSSFPKASAKRKVLSIPEPSPG